ncbi:unnamed protein product [Macrosiphum euphorbiae]|uniref:Uncharacterized protein n=1 Tax=Macrosiphum euphorbiae TaxID=13131 RepID=A0AAV0VZZ8_9HEMI|nr:unnamed protein product [Macrosiphum euphorbiae]
MQTNSNSWPRERPCVKGGASPLTHGSFNHSCPRSGIQLNPPAPRPTPLSTGDGPLSVRASIGLPPLYPYRHPCPSGTDRPASSSGAGDGPLRGDPPPNPQPGDAYYSDFRESSAARRTAK